MFFSFKRKTFFIIYVNLTRVPIILELQSIFRLWFWVVISFRSLPPSSPSFISVRRVRFSRLLLRVSNFQSSIALGSLGFLIAIFLVHQKMQMIETWTNLGLVWGLGCRLGGRTGPWNRSLRLPRCVVISGADCGSENRHSIRIRWLAKRSGKKSPFFFFVVLGSELRCFSRVCGVCSRSSFLLVAFVNSSSFSGNGFWCGSRIGGWGWWWCGERSDGTIRTGKGYF